MLSQIGLEHNILHTVQMAADGQMLYLLSTKAAQLGRTCTCRCHNEISCTCRCTCYVHLDVYIRFMFMSCSCMCSCHNERKSHLSTLFENVHVQPFIHNDSLQHLVTTSVSNKVCVLGLLVQLINICIISTSAQMIGKEASCVVANGWISGPVQDSDSLHHNLMVYLLIEVTKYYQGYSS